MREALVATAVALAVVACSGSPRSEPSSTGAPAPAAETGAVKPTPTFPRLDAVLNAILASDRPLEVAAERGVRVQGELLQVTISTAPEEVEALGSWLRERGAATVSWAGDEVQADVPVELLRALADHPPVRSVRRPSAIRDPGLR